MARPPALPLLALLAGCGPCGGSGPAELSPAPISLELPTPDPPKRPTRHVLYVLVDGVGEELCAAQGLAHLGALVADRCEPLELDLHGPGGVPGAFATLVTGVGPGEHGVFADSAVRWTTPGTAGERRAWGERPRRAPLAWEGLAADDYAVVTLALPAEAPPAPLNRAEQIVGAELPGPWGPRPEALHVGGGAADDVRAVEWGADGTFTWAGPGDLRLEGRREGDSLRLGDGVIALTPGAWSDRLRLLLPLPDGRTARAWTRAWLAPEGDRLFLSPLSAEAASPWLPLGHPSTAALDLEASGFALRSASFRPEQAAVRAGLLPSAALEQLISEALERRVGAAAQAARRTRPALLVLALPEVGALPEPIPALDRALGPLLDAHQGPAVLVGLGGPTRGRGLVLPELEGATVTGASLRLDQDLLPARRRFLVKQHRETLLGVPGVARVLERTEVEGPRSGLAPDLLVIPASGFAISASGVGRSSPVLVGAHEAPGDVAGLVDWIASAPR